MWRGSGPGQWQQQQPPPQPPGASDSWSFNPSHYTHLPNDQVDWANLAQQWIQMKEEPQQEPNFIFQMPPVPQQVQQPPPQQHFYQQQYPPSGEIPRQESRMDHDHDSRLSNGSKKFQQHPPGNQQQYSSFHNNPNWIPPVHQNTQFSRHPTPPQSTGKGFQGPSSLPGPWTSVKNNFGSGSNKVEQQYTSDQSYNWQQNATINESSNFPGYDGNPFEELDAAKRKTLPPWIREGLEKFEKEKRKKEEKDRRDAEKEARRAQKEAEEVEERRHNLEKEALVNASWSQIPRVDIHNSEGEQEEREEKPVNVKLMLQSYLENLSKEERLEFVMNSVRRQLTRLLVEATSEELEAIANDSLVHLKRKGLGGYGSDSDSNSASPPLSAAGSSDSESDSDEELIATIGRKKRNFGFPRSRTRSKSPSSSERKSPVKPFLATSYAVNLELSEVACRIDPSTKGALEMAKTTPGKGNKSIPNQSPSSFPSEPEMRVGEESPDDALPKRKTTLQDSEKKDKRKESRSQSKERDRSPSRERERKRRGREIREKGRKRSRSRSVEKTRKRGRSRSRDRDRSKSRDRSRSRDRKRRRDISRERSGKDLKKSKKKKRSRSRDRKEEKKSKKGHKRKRSRSGSGSRSGSRRSSK